MRPSREEQRNGPQGPGSGGGMGGDRTSESPTVEDTTPRALLIPISASLGRCPGMPRPAQRDTHQPS